jgi:Uma2 family endonuclease
MLIGKKTYSQAEYQRFQELPENKQRILELIDGEIIEKTPSFIPSRIAMRIGRFVDIFADERDLGYVTAADGGYIMSDEDTFNPGGIFPGCVCQKCQRVKRLYRPIWQLRSNHQQTQSAKCA